MPEPTWRSLAIPADLAARIDVIAAELRGHGGRRRDAPPAGRIPRWSVVERALALLEADRDRLAESAS